MCWLVRFVICATCAHTSCSRGQIFEMSAPWQQTGSAITITPNGARILRDWGFDHEASRLTEVLSMRLVDAHTLTPHLTENLEGVEEEFGAKLASYSRADVHRQLLHMATGDNNHQPGIPATIHHGSGIVFINCEAGEIKTGNGIQRKKDLVVIADGIRSNFASYVTGKNEPLMDPGWSTYRLSIPMHQLTQHDSIRPLFENQKPGFWAPFDTTRAFYMMTYPCKAGRILNIVLRHTTQPGEKTTDNWTTSAAKEDVLAIVSDYHPLISDIIKRASEVKAFRMLVREPLERFNRGRAVLLGDAAHTIMPTHAQGAVLAIEEAAALYELFNAVHENRLTHRRLDLYTEVLKKRIHMVQYLSNALPGDSDANRRKAEELWGPGLYSGNEYSFSQPVREFFYRYDVRAEMRRAMQGLEPTH